MPRKPTTTTTTTAPPPVIINAKTIMDPEEIRQHLKNTGETMIMQAVMAQLMWQIAETQSIAADPNAVNPDHARGQSYALSLLAYDLHRLIEGEAPAEKSD